MAKKPPNLKSFVTHTLRRASFRWPYRGEAMTNARVERGVYKCALCLGHFRNKEIHLDHIDPIVPITGFVSWDDFINKLFCEASGYQVLCSTCHESKTTTENEMRKYYRNLNKPKKLKKEKKK